MTRLLPPRVMLFDWQNTLASTMDALYNAVDDTLQLVKPTQGFGSNPLALYVKEYLRLPEDVKREKKMSRTDLFHEIFADATEREKTHDTFNECYKKHYQDVHAMDASIEPMLREYKNAGIKLGIVSNRKREFLQHELAALGWDELFQVAIAAGDGCAKKPSPEPLLLALEQLREQPGLDVWFIGDGKSDMQCGLSAGVSVVFYNEAKWTDKELASMFITPGTRPDAIVQNYQDFRKLVKEHL